MRDSYLLFIFQLFAHSSLIFLFLYGLPHHYLIVFFVYFITGCFGMTITYHRLLTHKSFTPPAWFTYFGTLAGVYGLTGSPIAWVAIHKEHHHYTDKQQDPHSPAHHGFIRVQWLSMFDKPNVKYAAHLLRSKFQLFVHKNYFLIHLFIILFWLSIDPMLLVAAYLAPAALLWNMGSFINTLTHMTGYKNFNTKDSSTNILWLGYLMWGEGWHNNHHAHPSSSSFKRKWWELDVGGVFIKLLDKSDDRKKDNT